MMDRNRRNDGQTLEFPAKGGKQAKLRGQPAEPWKTRHHFESQSSIIAHNIIASEIHYSVMVDVSISY